MHAKIATFGFSLCATPKSTEDGTSRRPWGQPPLDEGLWQEHGRHILQCDREGLRVVGDEVLLAVLAKPNADVVARRDGVIPVGDSRVGSHTVMQERSVGLRGRFNMRCFIKGFH